jgi:hypothetical protein
LLAKPTAELKDEDRFCPDGIAPKDTLKYS